MRESIVLIGVHALKQGVGDLSHLADPAERYRHLCESMNTVWLTGDRDERYAATVAVLLESYPLGSTERRRIEAQLEAYRELSHFMEGKGDAGRMAAAGQALTAAGGALDLLGIFGEVRKAEEERYYGNPVEEAPQNDQEPARAGRRATKRPTAGSLHPPASRHDSNHEKEAPRPSPPCRICGSKVPEREGKSGRQPEYCSRECRRFAAAWTLFQHDVDTMLPDSTLEVRRALRTLIWSLANAANRYGKPVRARARRKGEERIKVGASRRCAICGREFTLEKSGGRCSAYCSDACRAAGGHLASVRYELERVLAHTTHDKSRMLRSDFWALANRANDYGRA